MRKSGLKDLPTIRFPKSILLDALAQGDKVEYVYAARKINSGHMSVLELDFWALKDKGVAFRVFISKNEFITQRLAGDIPKWQNAQLDKLLDVYHYSPLEWGKAVPLNERSVKSITSFISPKIKALELKPEDSTPLRMTLFFQNLIRQRQLEKKHQKVKDRIDAAFPRMDRLPRNIDRWIEKYPLADKQYIFYKKEREYIHGYCSTCGKEVYPDKAKHLAPGICPACGARITFKAKGRSRNTYDSFVFSYMQKGIGGSVIQRVFEGHKHYKEGYDKPSLCYGECRRYVYLDANYKAFYFGSFKNTSEYRWCEGFPHKFMGYYSFTDRGSLFQTNLREVLKGTEW